MSRAQTSAARFIPPPADLALVMELLHEVLERQQRIEQLLESRRAPRDASDRDVLNALAASTIGHRFTAAEVFRHAAVVPTLAAALVAADIDNARQLGRLLKRMAGATVEEMQLEVVGEDREGLVYRLRLLRV